MTDFKKVLTSLRSWGVNDHMMSQRTGLDICKLSRLRTGIRKEASYADETKIMMIYQEEEKKHELCDPSPQIIAA